MKILKFIAIALLVLLLVIGLAALGVYSAVVSKQKIEDHSILELSFAANPAELSIEMSPIQSLILGESPPPTLKNTIELIEAAASDPQIDGISINGQSNLQHVTSMELNRALVKFRESGKSIYAHGDYYTQSAYLLASMADSIFIDPMGEIDLKGYSIILSYYKGFLDQYGIEMEIYSAGKFKSFVESYNRTSSSPQNRMQYEKYLYGLQEELIQTISDNRGIGSERIEQIIQENLAFDSDACLSLKLADVKSYKPEYETFLKEHTGREKSPVISLSRYKASKDFFKKKEKANAAYVVVEGSILDNEGNASTKKLRKAFEEIRKNDEIDLVLMRVNSPGGSGTASDRIWHEVELTKDAGKDVICSISSVAGSGGYYIMAGADRIYSAPGSVTGSIGVFIAFPVLEKALSDNLGIDFDAIKTGPHATRYSSLQELSEPQKENLRRSADDLYELFVKRVATGRAIQQDSVYDLAQGRIYSGTDAKDIGLVDETIYFVDLLDSLEARYELDRLVFTDYPKVKTDFSEFAKINPLFSLKSIGNQASALKNQIEELDQLLERPKVMSRMENIDLFY